MRRPQISPGRMLLIQLRKHEHRNALPNVDYYPSYHGQAVELESGESHVARVLASSRSVYYLTDRRVLLHEASGVVSVNYDDIVSCDWARRSTVDAKRKRTKTEFFDGVTLGTHQGDAVDLTGLDQAAHPLHA